MSIRDTTWPAGTPCWADLSVPDLPKAVEFYSAVLGWSLVDSGEEFGHYHIAQVKGHAAAGVGPVMAEGQPSFWTLYIASDDTDATAKLIADNGGTVIMPPMDVPEHRPHVHRHRPDGRRVRRVAVARHAGRGDRQRARRHRVGGRAARRRGGRPRVLHGGVRLVLRGDPGHGRCPSTARSAAGAIRSAASAA